MTTVQATTDNQLHLTGASEHGGITTMVADHWFADPEAWTYLAHHASQQRDSAAPGTLAYHLLSRAISLGIDMATALAAARADATQPDDETSPQPPSRASYVPTVRELLADGEHPEMICVRVARRPGAIARALRRAGCAVEARGFDRLVERTRGTATA